MNENAKKWVAALRSGEYKQCKGRLQRDDAYCCLGVATKLYLDEHPNCGLMTYKDGKLQGGTLDANVRLWLGLNTIRGGSNHKVVDAQRKPHFTLTGFNDHCDMDFNEIADIIESEPEGLFV